jgi:hypothetical protein
MSLRPKYCDQFSVLSLFDHVLVLKLILSKAEVDRALRNLSQGTKKKLETEVTMYTCCQRITLIAGDTFRGRPAPGHAYSHYRVRIFFFA